MSTDEEQGRYEDPFVAYEPGLAFAHQAAEQAASQLADAEKRLEQAIAAAPLRSRVEESARIYAESRLKTARDKADETRAAAERARANPDDLDAADDAVKKLAAFGPLHSAAVYAIEQIQGLPEPPPEPPETVPEPRSWAEASQATGVDTMAWVQARRAAKDHGQVLIERPSPGVGKTHQMIRAAIDEHMNRRRVVFASPTKEVALEEARPRIIAEGKRRLPMLFQEHKVKEIRGRDETNCRNLAYVKAAQDQGYAPGHAVCPNCEHHPDVASLSGQSICGYYQSRIDCVLMYETAGLNRVDNYPIIVTNHAALIAAFDSGGGRYSRFWTADTLFIDEDPTDALEPTIELPEEQCVYSDINSYPQHTYAARIFAAAIEQAKAERKTSEFYGFKGDDVHSRFGSAYTGPHLHDLLKRCVESLQRSGQSLPHHLNFVGFMRDAAHRTTNTDAGVLYGLTTTKQISRLVPPRSISEVAEAVYDENDFVRSEKLRHHNAVTGDRPKGFDRQAIKKQIEEASQGVKDWAYTVRLEYSPKTDKWQYVVESRTELNRHIANVIVGDAYAQVDHYRDLFNKYPDEDGNDPLHVIDHVAFLEPNVVVHRIPLDSRKGVLDDGELQRNLAWLEQILLERREEGPKRLLIYAHNELISEIEKWVNPRREELGLDCIDYEHYWDGRGKDAYKGYEITVLMSEPILHVGAMVHRVNARQYRAAQRDRNNLELRRPIRPPEDSFTRGTESGVHSYAYRNGEQGQRYRREHRRQNVAELAQAVHRTRPVIPHDYRRDIVVMGYHVALPPELIMSTATVETEDPTQACFDRAVLYQGLPSSFLGPSERIDFIEFVCSSKGLGFWVDEFFSHVFARRDLSFGPILNLIELKSRTETLLEQLEHPPDLWRMLDGVARHHIKKLRKLDSRGNSPWSSRGFEGQQVPRPKWQRKGGGRRPTLWYLPEERGGVGFQQAYDRYKEIIGNNYSILQNGSAKGPGAYNTDF